MSEKPICVPNEESISSIANEKRNVITELEGKLIATRNLLVSDKGRPCEATETPIEDLLSDSRQQLASLHRLNVIASEICRILGCQ